MSPHSISLQSSTPLHHLAQISSTSSSDKSHELISTPNQRRMAPPNLTPPSTPRELSEPREVLVSSASSKSESPPKTGSCPSRKEVAERLLDQAKDKMVEARKMGVDVAKTTFWKKSLFAFASAVGVGVAAGLTAISFGGAAPLLGLACASMVVSVGDAACAYRNYKNTEATAEGKPQPYAQLKAGNSFIGNLTFELIKKVKSDVSDETALKIAKGVGIGVAGGLALATVGVTAGLSSLPLVFELVSKTTSSVSSVASGYSAVVTSMTSEIDEDHLKTLQHECHDLTGRAKELSSEVDVTSIRQGVDESHELLLQAENDSGLKRDVVAGLAGMLGPIGGFVGKEIIGGSGDGGHGVRV